MTVGVGRAKSSTLYGVVNLDANDPAYKLAQAALDTLNGDVSAIDRAFKELNPTAETLTRAYALCLINGTPFCGSEATRLILNALQNRLAEKTAHRLNVLTGVLVFLTVVLIGFGVFDVYMRLHGCR
jgi:hypothetical protein